MSASSSPTTRPRRARATARFTLTDDLPTPPLPEATASTLVVGGMSVATARSWALSRALAMSADRSRRVHHPGADLDPLDAGEDPDLAFDVGSELIAERAGGDGEGDLHAHDAAVHADVAHHAELDDVGAELGVDDAGERGPDALD